MIKFPKILILSTTKRSVSSILNERLILLDTIFSETVAFTDSYCSLIEIKSILSSYIKLSTIIFDEIDTGISGTVSSKVADLMGQMSKNMQVIVITHTPQVASKGDFHYKVFKREVENKIITDIKLLDDKERVKEIAEMLSGDKSNKSANELANELLN